jgi:Flp pilus assembly protein TadB
MLQRAGGHWRGARLQRWQQHRRKKKNEKEEEEEEEERTPRSLRRRRSLRSLRRRWNRAAMVAATIGARTRTHLISAGGFAIAAAVHGTAGQS